MQCQTYYLCVCRRCCNENSTEPAGGEAHIALGGPVSLRQLPGQVVAVEAESPSGLKALRAAHLPAWKAHPGNVFSLAISRNEMAEMHKRWQQSVGTACPGEIMRERKKQQKINHS